MAKKDQNIPKISLAEVLSELYAINGQVFSLKEGTKNLIKMVEDGNIENAKQVIKIYDMHQLLENLNPEK
jgi:D-arabinose 1-dehydrogenase-like Zn-dependent alcohol dehydrogenase